MTSATLPAPETVPALVEGDKMDAREFERRYHAMPKHVKAELIDGTVYMASPVSPRHSGPHSRLSGWLFTYESCAEGTESHTDVTLRLGAADQPQPDGLLRIAQSHGGRSRVDPDGHFSGPAELAAEVALSTASLDLRQKKAMYLRARVLEYLVLRADVLRVEWFRLVGERYEPIVPDGRGLIKSLAFPGLWLDSEAMMNGPSSHALDALALGLASPEHAAFVERLRLAAASEGRGT